MNESQSIPIEYQRCGAPGWREQQIERMSAAETEWDMVIVGGGITGAGIYREAVHRGLRVLLVEQQDFAWGTSSRSSKMVHGGLRYLGSGQLRLANDSVKERQSLLDQLKGLVDPLPFFMGHYKGSFPGPWLFDKVLAVYDWMAGTRYRRFVKQGLTDFWLPGIQKNKLRGATGFGDAVTDDARLVLRVLQEANVEAQHTSQSSIESLPSGRARESSLSLNYVKAVDTIREKGKIAGLVLQDSLTHSRFKANTSCVVNATGAWTDELRKSLGKDAVIRPLRGSHLVVPFWRLPSAFTVSFFHPKDKRPVFVFPWEGVTVIGTTDLDHEEHVSREAAISEVELSYLLEAVNFQFPHADIKAADVVSTWSGVRPVVSKKQNEAVDLSVKAKPSDEKREHAVWNDEGLISVAGGKLTTYRLIALDVLQEAKAYLDKPLLDASLKRGTAFAQVDSNLSLATEARSMGLTTNMLRRLQGRYGQFVEHLVELSDLALGDIDWFAKVETTDTLWLEFAWACQSESVVHLDDLMLRRTRVGLLLGRGGRSIMSQVKLVCQHFLDWNDQRWKDEELRYRRIIEQSYSLPLKGKLSGDVHE